MNITIMKLRIKLVMLWSVFIASAVGLSSCSDFLTEDSQTAISEDKMFSDLEYTETNLKAIYTSWRNTFKDRYLWEMMVGTDEIQSGAFQALKSGMERGALDAYDANLNSENSYTSEQWTMRWPIVSAAAKIVKVLQEGDDLVVGEKRSQIYGEACFIRGSLEMELAMYWGEVPIIDLARIDDLGYGRQPLKDVWAFIINDLQEAVKYCPETNDPGRATTYAAAMMLGKALMAAPESTGLRDFAAAKQALEKVVNGPFQLVDYYDLWDYSTPNTKESIFEWQFSPVWPDNNQVQFQIGSRAVATWFGDVCYYSGYDHALPTEYAYSDVADGGLWEDGDIRKEESMRFDFTYYGKTPDLSMIQWEDLGDDYDELKPHIKKYEDFRTDAHSGLGYNNMWYSGKNMPYLRLADAILLYAECLNELGQTAQACQEVNKVRSRAWEFDLPSEYAWSGLSQDQFRTKIMDERMRELFGERWRRCDLIRTGKVVELGKARNKWTKKSGTIDAYNVRWPIPLTEIDQNDDISPEDQNEGYK